MTSYTATYSPDDNKLRLYATTRLDAETYARVKAAGFKWAPKQELFVAPMWTPGREDLLIELAGEIGDEDTSLCARAEERAERFEDYSDKRTADAHRARETVTAIADNIPFGQPILVGHHSEKHARKDAERIRSGMAKAVKMWETAGYWKDRAAGALAHAKYKELPAVRARRIKGIEADKRKTEKSLAEHRAEVAKWRKVLEINNPETQHKAALHVANFGGYWSMSFSLDKYPRNPPASQYEGPMGLWSALDGGVITATQAAEIALRGDEPYQARAARWIAHYENRLAYERAMLAESGGTVTDQTAPEKGGAVQCWQAHKGGWAYIQKVNKVSVSVLMFWEYSPRPCPTTVPLDKIRGVMTKAQVEAARTEGRLIPNSKFPQCGFHLADKAPEPATIEQAPKQPAPAADTAADFEAMRASLKAGVQTVAAPQLFPTPPDLARRMVELARICDGDRVLEPSAGTGNILACLRETANALPGGISVEAVEINQALCDRLRRSYEMAAPFQVSVIQDDFLEVEGIGTFDAVLMNPPFKDGADIKHIQRARSMLKEGGTLVAICANGPRQRAALMDAAEHWEDLPAGTFSSQGTEVNTALLVMRAA